MIWPDAYGCFDSLQPFVVSSSWPIAATQQRQRLAENYLS